MGEFFKGWRRKVGVLTLVMACVLTVGWVRSAFILDSLQMRYISKRKLQVPLLMSYNNSLIFYKNNIGHPISLPFWKTDPAPVKNIFEQGVSKYGGTEWQLRLCGFGIGDCVNFVTDAEGNKAKIYIGKYWIAPYWSIVIPLTLLSAYLLLTKPPKSNQKKIDEAVPVEGA